MNVSSHQARRQNATPLRSGLATSEDRHGASPASGLNCTGLGETSEGRMR